MRLIPLDSAAILEMSRVSALSPLRTSLAALACASGFIVFGLAARVPPFAAVVVLATFAAMAAGGIMLLRYAIPWERSALCVAVFGSILGLMLGRIGLILTGLVPVLRTQGLLVVAVALLVLALGFRRRDPLPPLGMEEDTQELPWIFGVTALALLVISPPFGALGGLTERGFAFVPNFNIDFFQHTAVTAEVARGIPPQNPLFAGERLHYYWFYHLWPAALANLTGVTAFNALVLTIPFTSALFVGAAALALRAEVRAWPARFFGIGLSLFAYSYIGLLFVAVHLLPAVSRMMPTYSYHREFSLLSHSWYRDFLYEPHAVTALTFLLFAFYLDRVSASSRALLARVLMGLALGVMVMTDTMIALIGLGWWGVMYLQRLIQIRRDRAFLVIPFAVVLVVVAGAIALGMFPMDRGAAGAVRLAIHPMAKFGPAYLLVELGPLFVFGVAGLGALVTARRLNTRGAMLTLLALSALCAFFFTVPLALEPDHVLRKGIKVLQLPLVVFAADAYAAYISRPLSRWLMTGIVVALVAGVLTLGTDIAHYTDLLGNKSTPTTYVTPDEMQVLTWIRTSTPRDAVFQVLSEVRPGQKFLDTDGSLVSTFGERRTLVGDAKTPEIFAVQKSTIASRRHQLERLFTAPNAMTARRILKQVQPDYLYVDGTLPGPVGIIQQLVASGFLSEAHRVNGITVLQMARGGTP